MFLSRIDIWKKGGYNGKIGSYQPEQDGYKVYTMEIGKLGN